MQLINSTVIRELSTIIFFRELMSGSQYLGGLHPGVYSRGLISVGLQLGANIRVAYIPGLISGSLYPGEYNRGLIPGHISRGL